MTVTMHYGIPMDPEKPSTGVRQNSRMTEAFVEALFAGIDLAWEEHVHECDAEYHDDCGPQERGDVLMGSWRFNEQQGVWEPDESGEYAAIARELVTQIVWSKHLNRGALCSPCYPGQVDQDSPGQYLGYDLPPEMTEDPVRIT